MPRKRSGEGSLFTAGRPSLDRAAELADAGQIEAAVALLVELLHLRPTDGQVRREWQRLSWVLAVLREAETSNPPQIELRVYRQVAVIRLEGVLTQCAEEGGLQTHFEQQVHFLRRLLTLGMRRFVVDMSQITFLSSYFLSVLLEWTRVIRCGGGQICVAGMPEEIRRVFRLGRLLRTIRCHDRLEQALEFLRADALPGDRQR